MQPISIFITPTSCAYDILDLPQHAKSSLSLSTVASCSDFLLFSLSLCLICLWLSLLLPLSLCSYLDTPRPPPSPYLWAQRPHYLDTLCEFCQSVNQPVCGLEVSVNLLRPMWRGCGITSPGKGHPLSAQKWSCQHIHVPGEPQCNYLILF